MNKKTNERSRNWTIVIYPDSAPENWREILKNEKISFAVSPLHDKDINEGTGEYKKPHFHVLLVFEGNKSYNQILTITKQLNAPIPQIVNSLKGMIRYFVHKDNPEKYQYDIKDIYTFGDIDISSPFLTTLSRYDAIREMTDFINEKGITEFCDLFEYASKENEIWFRYLCDSCSYVINQHIKSKRHRFYKEH